LAYESSTLLDSPNLNFSNQNEFIVKGRGFYFPFLFNPKKETSHEETIQNALSMLPVEGGCSVGSLT
jgi:hypothetical protein